MYYEADYAFGTMENFTKSGDGFDVAFGLTAYDSNQTLTEDSSYGDLKAYHYGWNENYGTNKDELKTEACSKKDLNLSEEKSETMYNVHEIYSVSVNTYW